MLRQIQSTFNIQRFAIYGTARADSINDDHDNIVIAAGASADTVIAFGAAVTIEGGSGADKIIANGAEDCIHGDSGNDTIISVGDGVTIDGGSGAVQIIGGKNVSPTFKPTVPSAFVSGADVPIVGPPTILDPPPMLDDPPATTSSALKISNGIDNTLIVGTNEDDTVFNTGSNVTVSTGSGNDVVSNSSGVGKKILGQHVLIETGDGDDSISNNSPHVTIRSGNGADTVTNQYDDVFIDVANGHNSVNSSGRVTIQAGNGADSINTYGSSNISINAGDGKNFVMSNSKNGTVFSGSGADLIYVGGNNPFIQTGAGNDSIFVGNHIFHIQYPLSSVNYHFASSSNGTIDAGSGNDIINFAKSTGNVMILQPNGGHDTIIGGAGNSLSIDGSTKYTVEERSDTFIVSLEGGATATFQDTAKNSVKVLGGSTGGTDNQKLPLDVMQDFMFSLDNSTLTSAVVYQNDGTTISAGAQELDDALSFATRWSNFEEAKTEFIDSLHIYLNSDPVNGGENWLLRECGINLNNEDTGALIGYDAGYSSVELNASDVVQEVGILDETFTGNSFTVKGLHVYLDKDFSQLINVERYLWQGLHTWWLPAALELIETSYGENFSFGAKSSSTLNQNKIRVVFYDENDGVLASVSAGTMNSRGETQGPLTLKINLHFYADIIRGDEDGKSLSTSHYLDRTLAHEFVHATMNANIPFATGNGGLPQFVKDGIAEVVHGVDDTRRFGKAGIIALSRDLAQLDAALDVNKFYGAPEAYPGGYIFWRYVGWQNSDLAHSNDLIDFCSDASTEQIVGTVKGAVLTVKEPPENPIIDLAKYDTTVTKVNAMAPLTGNVEIVGTARKESIKTGSGDDQLYGGAGNDTLYGGAGTDTLFGGSGNDKLYGDAGNDTLIGGLGNDTLTGGAGADLFVYESGTDFIVDYSAGTDKIQLGAEIIGASLSGTNVVLKTSSGNLTVKNGKNKAITVIDASGKETSQVYPLSTLPAGISVSGAVLTATAAFTGREIDLADYATNITRVNASALSRGASIVGTAAANSLKGGKYADTISGGNGNDTVSLGGGADVYIYSGGNDLIQDYTVGADKIKLASASITGASLSGTNVVLKTSSGNLTVKNGKNKAITVIDSSGKETTQLYPSYLNYDAGKTAVTLASGFTGTLKATDYANSVKKIDAAAVTKAIQIIGNDQANTIFGSAKVDTINGGAGNDSLLGAAGNDKLYGDDGADTLIGGAGNDTLTGGTGNDTFVYGGEGKDVITDYTAEADTIKISSGSITKTAYSGTNVIFTVSSGTLTIKNAKGKAISITDANGQTSTKTYTTGVTYGSNGTRGSNALWFTEDDTNFIGETNLDAISAENYAVTNIESARVENLVMNDSLSSALTFYAK